MGDIGTEKDGEGGLETKRHDGTEEAKERTEKAGKRTLIGLDDIDLDGRRHGISSRRLFFYGRTPKER